MQDVVAATAAILLKLQAVRVIPLVLGGSVIALLAGGAGQVNYNAVLLSCHFKRSLSLKNLSGLSSAGQTFRERQALKTVKKIRGPFFPTNDGIILLFTFQVKLPHPG